MRSPRASLLPLAFAVVLLPAPSADAEPQTTGPEAWSGCCGLTPWPAAGPMASPNRSSSGSRLFRGYANIVVGSALRHRLALSGQIPAKFASLRNPLPANVENAQRGQTIYDAQCASCHGAEGLGDGPASRTLTPKPAELGWITNLPRNRWDSFMYWSTAEGGAAYQTAMPSFKDKLSQDEIWSVIGYIQARAPKTQKKTR